MIFILCTAFGQMSSIDFYNYGNIPWLNYLLFKNYFQWLETYPGCNE